jgi:hypothetical protein
MKYTLDGSDSKGISPFSFRIAFARPFPPFRSRDLRAACHPRVQISKEKS